MSATPCPPWTLECPWCEYHILVNARGSRRGRPGAGEEAADLMRLHVSDVHDKRWHDFLWEPASTREDNPK